MFLTLVIFLLMACSSVPSPSALPTPSLSPMPIPTSTPVWFPPTPTFTPLPLRASTSTPDWFSAVDGVLFADSLTEARFWNLARSSTGSVSLQDGSIVLVAQPASTLFTLRNEPLLDTFYLEVTAELSLCRGDDLYGVLFRYSENGAYRYGLDCRGQVRLDRIKGNVRYPLYPPTPSGDAPPGAPGVVRIGVLTQGRMLRFFLNGRFQFEVQDGTLTSGLIGFFARPAGDTPLTVRFANLVVYSLRP